MTTYGEGHTTADRARLLHGLTRASRDQNTPQSFCRALYEAIPCERVCIGQINRLTGRVRGAYWPPLPESQEKQLVAAFTRHGLEHPRLRAFLHGKRVAGVASWHAIDPEGAFTRTGLYREFYRPRGITDQLSFRLPAPGPVAIGVTIDRINGRFTDDEVDFLEAVRSALATIPARQPTGTTVLSALGWVAVSLADDGTVLSADDHAEERGALAGLPLGAGDSLSATELWAQLGPHLQRSLIPVPPAHDPVIHTGADPLGRAWLLEIPPLGPAQLYLDLPALVIEELAALTPRQRDIARLLADGLTNKQIAARLGLSTGTVRTHIQRMFQTLGVHTRAAAVVKLLPARALAHRSIG